VEIARQALDALSYLHDQELIHRDVATDNFMLTRGAGGQLVVKLIDLGIAKSLSSESAEQLTAAATFLGKARYTAPEQFKEQGARHLTKASDVYSFGVVLYELLTGRSPIQGNDLAAIFASHLFEPPLGFELSDPDRRVPPELRALVLRALEKDPAARFESAGAMLAELRCCYDTPVSFADADGVLAAHAAHAAHAAAGGRGGESGNEADGEEDPDRRAYRDLSEATAPSGAGPALKSAVRPRREATTGVAAAAAPASAASQPLAGGVAEPASRQDLIDRLEALPTRELEGGAQDRMTETVILRSSAPSARGPKLLPWIIAAVVLTLLVAAFLLSRG
jgi:serine/threonine-protein kinase